jgi:asparagine synthase (glutamine-hydrolysing)
MCGIAGYFLKRPLWASGTPDLLAALDRIAHRGPDGMGVYLRPNVGLGHRRLSIIDLTDAGSQPISSGSGRFIMVFNGEIYNYAALRQELEREGVIFRGSSDSEVLVNSIEKWGTPAISRLNGIFAFAIWDTQTEVLTLARDRCGVKPLYLYEDEGIVLFASEIKGILSQAAVSTQLDYQALSEFLYYGNALGQRTLFQGIRRLLPAQFAVFSSLETRFNCYWSPEQLPKLNHICYADARDNLRQLLEQAVRSQLVSDVPVGIFLSGGIDSSAIAASAARNSNIRLSSYCAAFDFDDGHNELKAARRVARQVGTDHHEIFIKGESLDEVIIDLVRHHDEPFADPANIPLYLLTKEIRGRNKVILQGDGGDELFGGYSRYRFMRQLFRYRVAAKLLGLARPLLREPLKEKLLRLESILGAATTGESFARLLTNESRESGIPESIFLPDIQAILRQMNPFLRYSEIERRYASARDLVQRLLLVDFSIILPDQFLEKVDKATMANGIEVRVPFLDNDLVNYALSLPASMKMRGGHPKALLRDALRGLVPEETLQAKKKGFGVPHLNWLAGPLLPFLRQSLREASINFPAIFNVSQLDLLVNNFEKDRSNGPLLWKALQLSIWLREYKVSF